MTGECSPVEAIRFTGGSGSAKAQKRENVGLVFMAFQNMFRDKEQAVVIFLSLIIAVSVFLVANVYIKENDAKLILDTICSEDITFKNETTIEDDRQRLWYRIRKRYMGPTSKSYISRDAARGTMRKIWHPTRKIRRIPILRLVSWA